MQPTHSLTSIPDDELLRRLAELLGQSRRVESDLVAHVGEVDLRRLYARQASPSMFSYCTEVLHLSEAEAYLRIAAARASREHPVLLEMLADGRLHLTGIEAGAAPDPGESGDASAGGRRQVQAADRGADRGALPPAGCPGGDTEAPQCRSASWERPGIGRDGGLELRPEAVASGGVRLDRVMSSSTRLRPDGVAPTGLEPVAALSSAARPGRIEPLALGRSGSSSPPVPSSARSSSDSGRSGAAPSPTGISPPSSKRRSPRSSRGSRRGVSPGRRLRGRLSPTGQPAPDHATCRPSDGPCTSATGAVAATWTSRGGGAPLAKASSSTTGTRSATGVTTR